MISKNSISGSRIQQQQQKRRGNKIFCPTFFCSHKYQKIKIIILLYRNRKKFLPIHQKFKYFFNKKIVTKLSKLSFGIWDPDKRTYSGSRGQKGTGFRIRKTDEFRAPDPKKGYFISSEKVLSYRWIRLVRGPTWVSKYSRVRPMSRMDLTPADTTITGVLTTYVNTL